MKILKVTYSKDNNYKTITYQNVSTEAEVNE